MVEPVTSEMGKAGLSGTGGCEEEDSAYALRDGPGHQGGSKGPACTAGEGRLERVLSEV